MSIAIQKFSITHAASEGILRDFSRLLFEGEESMKKTTIGVLFGRFPGYLSVSRSFCPIFVSIVASSYQEGF